MKNILDLYSKYKIMPTLQQHQLRVAGVAKQICDAISKTIDKEGVVDVCLVHDMGNIIKFDLTYFPDFVQPEGLEYWQSVKDEYIQKYGPEEHFATEMICKEIGLSDAQIEYLHAIGFSRVKKALASDSLEKKICCYADQRVGPHGVLSVQERLVDGRKRYEGRKDKALVSEQFEELAVALSELEKEIFSHASIQPSDITDESIAPIIESFK
jgi:hypothetical protein